MSWSTQWSVINIGLTTVPGIVNLVLAPAFLWSMNRPFRGWHVSCNDPEINKSNCKLINPALPPWWFFSGIRFVLLGSIGISWGWTRELLAPASELPFSSHTFYVDLGFSILTALLFIWSLLFASGATMRYSVMYLCLLLLCSAALTVYICQTTYGPGYFMLPLLIWQIYSMYLNISNVTFYLKPLPMYDPQAKSGIRVQKKIKR